MKKVLFLIFIFLVSFFQPVFAEKIPVKITPIQTISTHHDEIETGDWIEFEVVDDVYKEDKLFLKKGTKIIGVVDYVHNNGWLADSAEIKLKNFTTVDSNKKKIEITYAVNIDGSKFIETESKQYATTVITNTANVIAKLSLLGVLIRGSEIFIEPDAQTFNLFIDL